ncbi:MAG: InlB B-repeat-containing protein, partial [Oscillospiraceae bacterium]|nr:InlB B-repeat-containing protein [Oscillospiraceae bacterium]
MNATKARRGLSGLLAVLMVFSLFSAALATRASAMDWGVPYPDSWGVDRNAYKAVPPKVELLVPDRIEVAATDKFTYGLRPIKRDSCFSFRLTDAGQGLTLLDVKATVSNASNDHVMEIPMTTPKVDGGGVYKWGIAEGGIAIPNDVARITVEYTVRDNSGVRRTWRATNYCNVDAVRGEAFYALMVNKLSYLGAAEHWCDTVLWMPGSFGFLENYNSIPKGKMTGGTDAVGAFSFGFITEQMKNYTAPDMHAFAATWGMNSGDALQNDAQIVENPQYAGKTQFPGFVLRVKEKWAPGTWIVGSTNSDNEDLAAIRGKLEGFTPKAHFYYDLDPTVANAPVQLGAATMSTGGDGGYEGGNARISVTRYAGHAATMGTWGGFSAGNVGLGSFSDFGNKPALPLQSSVESSFHILRQHRFEWSYFGTRHADFDERLDLVVHFYDKQYLRKVVQTVQALAMQENWMMDDGDGSYSNAYLGSGALPDYNSWSNFESAYAAAVALLNRKDVPAADGNMQKVIDEATAAVLDNIQNAGTDEFGVATPAGFVAQYAKSHDGAVYSRAKAHLYLKSADYGGVTAYLLHDLPPEYAATDDQGNLINHRFWSASDFERLDKAVQDLQWGFPLDVRYQAALAQMRANLREALWPNDQALQFRTYDVRFYTDYEANVMHGPAQQVRVYDEILPPVTNPTKERYLFGGWERQMPDGTWQKILWDDPELDVHEYMYVYDVNYRAIWIPNALVVHWITEFNGSSIQNIPDTWAFLPNEEVFPPDAGWANAAPHYGYVFDEWIDRDTGESVFTPSAPTIKAIERGERYLKATWKPVKNDVVFWRYSSGNEEWLRKGSVAYDSQITEPQGIPVRKGFSFKGWSTTADGTSTIDWAAETVKMTQGAEGGQSVMSFYPVYDAGPVYTLAYYSRIPNDDKNFLRNNDGIFYPEQYLIEGEDACRKLAANTPFTVLDESLWPSAPGADFAGEWYYLDENTYELKEFTGFENMGGEAKMPAHNLYLFPKFIGEEKRLVFHANQAGVVESFADPYRTLTKETGAAFEVGNIPMPGLTTHRFLGWFKADGTKFISATMPYLDGEELHLYARWQELRADNVSITMQPDLATTPGTQNGATLLPGDFVKLDLSLRSTFPVYGNYTMVYYDKTYFEPALPGSNNTSSPYTAALQGADVSTDGFITIDSGNGLWDIGNAYADVNVSAAIDYPASWKDENNQLLPQYERYGVIAVKLPYDFGVGAAGVSFGDVTPWFSFYLRVKDGLSVDGGGVAHPAPATPDGETANIFFSEEAVRDFEAGRRVEPMYYSATPASDGYESVEVLTSPALQYIIDSVADPISVTFVSDAVKGPAVDRNGVTVTSIRFTSGLTIADLKASRKWPTVQEAKVWDFLGWVRQSDYELYLGDVSTLKNYIFEEQQAITESVTLCALYAPALRDITLEYRLQNRPGSAQPYTVDSAELTPILRGESFILEAADPNFRTAGALGTNYPGYTYVPELSHLGVTDIDQPTVIYQYFTLRWITFSFDMDGTDNGVLWDPVSEPYGSPVTDAVWQGIPKDAQDNTLIPHKVGYTWDSTKIAVPAEGVGVRPAQFTENATFKPAWKPRDVKVYFIVENTHPTNVPQNPAYWVVGSDAAEGFPAKVGDDLNDNPLDIPVLNGSGLQNGFVYADLGGNPSAYGYKYVPVPLTDGVIAPTDDAAVYVTVGRVVQDGRPVRRIVVLPDGAELRVDDPDALIPSGGAISIPTMEDVIGIFGDALPEAVLERGRIRVAAGIEVYDGQSAVTYTFDYGQNVLVPTSSNKTKVVEVRVYLEVPDTFYFAYDANGGNWTDEAPTTQSCEYVASGRVESGDWLSNPAVSRAGYRFVGWSVSASAKEASSFVNMVKNTAETAVKLFAVWVPEVSFADPNGYLAAVPDTRVYSAQFAGELQLSQGDLPQAADVIVSSAAHVFVGWSITQTAPAKAPTQPGLIAYTEPVTAFPVLRVKTNTLAFNATSAIGAPVIPDVSGIAYGESVTMPDDTLTANGKSFLGWTDELLVDSNPSVGDGSAKWLVGQTYSATSFNFTQEDDGCVVTLYPVWEDVYYSIYFTVQDGQAWVDAPLLPIVGRPYGMITQAELASYGEAVTQEDANGIPMVFSHWAVVDGSGVKQEQILVDADLALYPVFVSAREDVRLVSSSGSVVVYDDDQGHHYVFGFSPNTSLVEMFGDY